MKTKLPNGNFLIVVPPPRKVNIPSVLYPRQLSGFSPLNASYTATHGYVVFLTSNYSGPGQWYYILAYNLTVPQLAPWIYIDGNYVAPPAPIHATGWTVNFYYKPRVIDKLTPAQFAAL